MQYPNGFLGVPPPVCDPMDHPDLDGDCASSVSAARGCVDLTPFAFCCIPLIRLSIGRSDLIRSIPESPWHLVRKGKLDKARRSLEKLYYGSGENVDQHLARIQEITTLEMHNRESVSFFDIFRGSNLRRTVVSSMTFVCQEMAGESGKVFDEGELKVQVCNSCSRSALISSSWLGSRSSRRCSSVSARLRWLSSGTEVSGPYPASSLLDTSIVTVANSKSVWP